MTALAFRAPLGWQPSTLADALPDGLQLSTESQSAKTIYFDTVDRALGRSGVIVTISGGVCTVRLPGSTYTVAAPSTRAVPRDVQAVLLGVRIGRRLIPVGTSEALSRTTRVVDAEETTVATIVDLEVIAAAVDGVEVVQARHAITLDAADDGLRRTLRAALRSSGARRSSEPEHATEPVVALTALAPDEHAGRPSKGSVGRLVTDYLAEQRTAIVRGDLALRRGDDAVHATRVAMRRYRSALRVYRALVDRDRANQLTEELRWFAFELGVARDAHVRRTQLAEAVDGLDPTLVLGPVSARIDTTLRSAELKAREQVDRVMRGKRYLALLAALESWQLEPPLTGRAARPAKNAATYLRNAERLLRKRTRGAKHASDEQLHAARKAAKRLRYAAEIAEPALGSSARKVRSRAKKLQTALGNYLDAMLACDTLRRLGAATASARDENGFTFGVLYELQREKAAGERRAALRLLG